MNDEETTNEDYEHAKTVWKEFGIKTLGEYTLKEYTSLYNKVDVLQLADVFENFRDICLGNYKLNPAWYYTSPGLAWDAMLKRTGISLELLTDIDMLLIVTNGGVKSAQTPPCDILFFSVCLESPENQVTQTPFRIKRKI